MLLFVCLGISCYFIDNPRPASVTSGIPSSYQPPTDSQIIEDLLESPLKVFFLEILTLLIIFGIIAGLLIDFKFVVEVVKAKTLGFSEKFPGFPVNLSTFLKVSLLMGFFYLAFKFVQIYLNYFFPSRVLSIAITFNGLFEIASIICIVSFFGERNIFSGRVSINLFTSALRTYIGILPILLGVLLLNILIFRFFKIEPEYMQPVKIIFQEKSLFNVALLLLEGAIFAPLFEELFFRGLFYGLLRNRFSIGFSALASGLFFSLLHQNAFAFLPIFILGLSFAFLYERTKNIFVPILLHAFHNSFILVLIFIIKPW